MSINIKPSHRGLFTAKAQAAGMSVQQFASKVLSDPSADPATKKQANFARNAKSFHHKKRKAARKALDGVPY
jgi:hypothetical protein